MMPRGGQNKKDVLTHLKEGTYRAGRHGMISSDDFEVLSKMKEAINKEFSKAITTLNDNKTTPEDKQKSKQDMIDYAELYHKLSIKIPPHKEERKQDDGSIIMDLFNEKKM